MTIEAQATLTHEVDGNAHQHKLEEIYAFRNATEVYHFLLTYPHLIDILLEAQSHLEKHFGPDPHVTLEVVSDPEVVSPRKQLFAYIRTYPPFDEALARLDQLDEEWFLDQVDRVDDLFNFNLEAL